MTATFSENAPSHLVPLIGTEIGTEIGAVIGAVIENDNDTPTIIPLSQPFGHSVVIIGQVQRTLDRMEQLGDLVDSDSDGDVPSLGDPPTDVAGQPAEIVDRIEETLDRIEQLGDLLKSEVDSDYVVPVPRVPLSSEFTLSIVVPIYNEESTLRAILGRVAKIPFRKELVLVDDCSTDGTRSILRSLEKAADVRVMYKPRNEGKGAALRAGFAMATGDIVVVQDADLEYDPRDIPRLIEPIIRGDAEVVYGSRFLGDDVRDPSWVHRFGNAMLTGASNLLTGLVLTDMETCYKAFRREVLADIEIRQNRFGFEPEITAKLARRGYRFAEIPIAYHGRGYQEGKKIGIKDALEALYCILRYGLAD